MNKLWWVAELLVVIGAINWGLVGAFNFNLVEAILGSNILTDIIYILVGLSGLWAIKLLMNERSMKHRASAEHPVM